MAITFTEKAAQHINQAIAKKGQGIGLRIKIELRGCSGYAYVTEFAEAVTADDEVFTAHDAKVIVDKKYLPLIDGTHMDYIQQGINWQWDFKNPQADSHCGCGESFNLKDE